MASASGVSKGIGFLIGTGGAERMRSRRWGSVLTELSGGVAARVADVTAMVRREAIASEK